jgi:glyoxylase-like metal-dependent hydrolase (beta-lactamase superfamily II)
VRVERFSVGPWANNLYLLTGDDSHDGILVDPSMESEETLDTILRRGIRVRRILLTHAHIDHIHLVHRFHDRTGAPVWLHPGDADFYANGGAQASMWGLPWEGAPPVAHWIRDGEEVGLPGIPVRAWHTPGHSPGSVTFETEDGLLVGDVLFSGSVGRTDLPGGDWDTLVASIREVLFERADDARVCPGHGPETTIGAERRANPFVGDQAAGLGG